MWHLQGDMGAPLACRRANHTYYIAGVLTQLTATTCVPPYTPVVFELVRHYELYLK